MTGTEPHEERWAYGGIRLLHASRMVAWLPTLATATNCSSCH